MSRLDEMEHRLETTVFAKAGDRASEYIHPQDVALLIRAVRQLARGRRYLYGYIHDERGGGWSNFDLDVVKLIEGE